MRYPWKIGLLLCFWFFLILQFFWGAFGRAMSGGPAPLLKCSHLWKSWSLPRLEPGGIWVEKASFLWANICTHSQMHTTKDYPKGRNPFCFCFFFFLSCKFALLANTLVPDLFIWCIPIIWDEWMAYDRWRWRWFRPVLLLTHGS